MPEVNPKILTWSRERAGLTLEEASKKLNVSVISLEKMEYGDKSPTQRQLFNMSKKYHRSLTVFYLEKPPILSSYGEDFRTLPDSLPPRDNANVDALLRDIKMRQSLVSEILEDEDYAPPHFIGSANLQDSSKSLAEKMTKDINFSLREFRKCRKKKDAFDYLRRKVEDAGIFVLLVGNLGSHHTNIPVKIFRGFALADDFVPFIVINPDDLKVAMAFTVLHELAHLYLGEMGISGNLDSASRVEKKCNSIASEILLPSSEVKEILGVEKLHDSFDEIANKISKFAEQRNLSNSMVAYKLFLMQEINHSLWKDLSGFFYDKYIEGKEKNRLSQSGEMKISNKVRVISRLGGSLFELTKRSIREGNITYTKAAKIFGVKAHSVGKLIQG